MIRIALCDDEPQILDEVLSYIKNMQKRKTINDLMSFALILRDLWSTH